MVTAKVHPSQQRLSCEGCRKHKSRCQRLSPSDPKCARCMMLQIDCIAGKQRAVGRPRRAIGSSNGRAPGRNSIEAEQQMILPKPLLRHKTQTSPSLPTTNQRNRNNVLSPSLPASIISSLPNPPTTPEADFALSSVVTTSNALAKLCRINLDLHIRMATAETNKDAINLNDIIYRQGPLFIKNLTLAEFTLHASQAFLSVLTQLQSSLPRDNMRLSESLDSSALVAGSNDMFPHPHPFRETLAAPVALAITSIFMQLIDLYELALKHLFIRIERIDIEPIMQLPGLTFGGSMIEYPCTQAILFIEVLLDLLDRTERALGISLGPVANEGLLSPRQMDTLWSEISGDFGLNSGYGVIRPASVRDSFQNAKQMLKQISLNSVTR